MNFSRPAALVRPLLAALAGLCLAGCAVGPNFERPKPPAVSDYNDHAPATTVTTTNVAGGEAQRFAKGAELAGDWWMTSSTRPRPESIWWMLLSRCTPSVSCVPRKNMD